MTKVELVYVLVLLLMLLMLVVYRCTVVYLCTVCTVMVTVLEGGAIKTIYHMVLLTEVVEFVGRGVGRRDAAQLGIAGPECARDRQLGLHPAEPTLDLLHPSKPKFTLHPSESTLVLL